MTASANSIVVPVNPWEVLHRRALAWRVTTSWLADWEQTISCGDCREEWRRIKIDLPFRVADQFAWSVAAHNAVNAKLDKPALTVDEARQHWQGEAPPAATIDGGGLTGPKKI